MATESEELRSTSPKRLKLCIMDPLSSEALEESSDSNIIQDTPDSLTSPDSAVLEGKILEQDSSTLGSVSSDAGADSDGEADNDSASTTSSASDASAISSISGQGWKPACCASMRYVEKLMMYGADPRFIYSQITRGNTILPQEVSDGDIWRIIGELLCEPPRRNHLPDVKTLQDVVRLLDSCKKIMVLTGAGVSVSCGIPDFRSSRGVYSRLRIDFPDLPDPTSMFDIQYFRRNPQPFFRFAKEIYPGQFKPSPCHRFIKLLEKKGKLLRNYTQNIDTLERVAGIENVIECHGSFLTATCTKCQHKVTSEDIRRDIFEQRIPYCQTCSPQPATEEAEAELGIMKPDIVFFGEGLPEAFHDAMSVDKDQCDLLIVIGSSLKVKPVALIPNSLPAHVPQILINRERLSSKNFDVELLGDSDVIIDQLCYLLGEEWSDLRWRPAPLTDGTYLMAAKGFNTFPRVNLEGEEQTEEGKVVCQRIAKRASEVTEGRSLAGPSDKEGTRHGSHDSSRDSGIGEASNSSVDTFMSDTPPISSYLTKENIFYRMRRRCFVFPGAEVYNSCANKP